MPTKTLEQYIEQYGQEAGVRRYNGVLKSEETKRKKYATQPFKRLTKEWYVWRYGEEEGMKKFLSFAKKSAHTLDNFIANHGVEEGTRRYEETIAKKNTVAIVKDRDGQEAVDEWYTRAIASGKKTRSEYTQADKDRVSRSRSQALKKVYAGRTKLQVYIDKHGEIDGPIEYAKTLQKQFKAKGTSVWASEYLDKIVLDNPWLSDYTLMYRTGTDSYLKEWFIADKTGICFYDFTVLEARVILEMDGARWHPTEQEFKETPERVMDITNLTVAKAWHRDQSKIQRALDAGFKIFVIRSDDTEETKQEILSRFLQEVRNASA